MGGTWMAFVQGFGGMRVVEGKLHFNPFIPDGWKSYSFKLNFRNAHLEFRMNQSEIMVLNNSKTDIDLVVHGQTCHLPAKKAIAVSI